MCVCVCVYIYILIYICVCVYTYVYLPGESHGQRVLMDCSPLGVKESDELKQLITYIHTRHLLCVRHSSWHLGPTGEKVTKLHENCI